MCYMGLTFIPAKTSLRRADGTIVPSRFSVASNTYDSSAAWDWYCPERYVFEYDFDAENGMFGGDPDLGISGYYNLPIPDQYPDPTTHEDFDHTIEYTDQDWAMYDEDWMND